ncbi:MAG: dihydrofolate reductase [Chloroflexales bacterium]|nr:dihydrofolate reductase [Chloroflexales bacterium]
MRKLVASFFISLDGVVQGPGPGDDFDLAGWTMPYWDDDVAAFVQAGMQAADTLLLGRVTYQGFAAAFAASTGPDAELMNRYRKYVVSTTLDQADWANSSLITGNVVEEVTKLKQQGGQDIGMSGSGTLVQALLRHQLIDELNLLIYPVVLGRGKRLFADGLTLNLQLKQSTTSRSGVLLTTYQVA